jgi:ribosomal protein S27AE
MSVFIFCPRCGGTNIADTDYEVDGATDFDGRVCEDCGWEGDVAELVCDDSDEEESDPEDDEDFEE